MSLENHIRTNEIVAVFNNAAAYNTPLRNRLSIDGSGHKSYYDDSTLEMMARHIINSGSFPYKQIGKNTRLFVLDDNSWRQDKETYSLDDNLYFVFQKGVVVNGRRAKESDVEVIPIPDYQSSGNDKHHMTKGEVLQLMLDALPQHGYKEGEIVQIYNHLSGDTVPVPAEGFLGKLGKMIQRSRIVEIRGKRLETYLKQLKLSKSIN